MEEEHQIKNFKTLYMYSKALHGTVYKRNVADPFLCPLLALHSYRPRLCVSTPAMTNVGVVSFRRLVPLRDQL